MPDPEPIWQSARWVGLDDRGLNYGDGVFETMLARDGQLPFEAQHRQRLQLGCERILLDIDPPELDAILSQVRTATTDLSWAVAKLIATRAPSGRGYGFTSKRANLVASVHPAGRWGEHPETIRCAIASLALAEQPRLAGIKHLNRLEQVLARAEFGIDEFPELILLDGSRRVVEGVASNVFVVRDNVIATPWLGRCGVAGIARQYLLERMAIEERDIDCAELAQADEIFLTNSVRAVRRVGTLVSAGEVIQFPHDKFARRAHHELRKSVC